MKRELSEIKQLLQFLDPSELRTIEDYCQGLRLKLQEELLKRFKNED